MKYSDIRTGLTTLTAGVASRIPGRRRRARRELESIAGIRSPKPPVTSYDELIEYRGAINSSGEGGEFEEIDRVTLSDLDLPQFHEAMNSTLSIPGEVMLFTMITSPPSDSRVPAIRRDLIGRFARETAPDLLRTLHRLGREKHADVTSLIYRSMASEDPRFRRYLAQSALAILLTVAAIAGVGGAVIPMVVILIVNLVTWQLSTITFTDLLPKLASLVKLIEAADSLADSVDSTGTTSWESSSRVPGLRRLIRSTNYLVTRPEELGEFVGLLMMYPKAFLLFDALVYRMLVRRISRHLPLIERAYRFVGDVDALQSLAVWSASLPRSVSAAIVDGTPRLDARGVYHPLLADAVANDVSLRVPGVVLTGANMAGKSTFLRTVAVNMVLARTIGLCAADRFETSPFRVITLIRKSDSLAAGTSLYLYEARRIYEMLAGERSGSTSKGPPFLAVDEFFAGTNSIERIAAATAVLRHLAASGCVTIAATHDAGIAWRLASEYALAYFGDRFEAGEVTFDYRIRPGVVSTTNAIALLAAIGYPDDIVEAARAIASSRGDASGRVAGDDYPRAESESQ